jgi:predicted transcriptional regulator of viral defense system
MKRSKYLPSLRLLLKKPFFTAKDAAKKEIPSYALSVFCNCGMMERIARGIYRSISYQAKVDVQWERLVLTAKSIPNGIICLISALCIYELTDQIMREYWIAIPNHAKSPKRPYVRIIRMRNLILGKGKIQLGEYKINIFDRERTIVDAFRLLSHEVAIKALKAYLAWPQGKKPDLIKLQKYATLLGVDLNPYILSLTI